MISWLLFDVCIFNLYIWSRCLRATKLQYWDRSDEHTQKNDPADILQYLESRRENKANLMNTLKENDSADILQYIESRIEKMKHIAKIVNENGEEEGQKL